jgi:hypothetical protein
MPVPVPVVVAPADLLGLEALYLAPGGDSRTGSLVYRQPCIVGKWMRRKRRGPRARRQCGRARGSSKSEFQKVTAFHDISSSVHSQ